MDEQTSTRVDVASLLEIVGFVCFTVAAFAFDWRAGLATVGLLLVGLSFIVSRGEQ